MGNLQNKIAAGLLATGIASFCGGVMYDAYHTYQCKKASGNPKMELYHLAEAQIGSGVALFSINPVFCAMMLSKTQRKREE